jgi:monoamine oxidase
MKNAKHIIVGAGITGLYLAYKLILKGVSAADIVIFEGSDRIGGRIYTNEHKGFRYSVGAGRLGKKHKYVMKIIKDFKLQDQIINIGKNTNYFVEGRLMNEEELLKHYKSNFKSLNELWRYAIEKKLNGNKYDPRLYNLHNYFSLILDENEVELLKISLGYIGEMYDMNAYNGLLTLRKDFDIRDNEFFVLRDGIHILCDVLYKYILDAGASVIFSSMLEDVCDGEDCASGERGDKKYIKVNGEKHSYSKLYLTIKRGDYMNIGYFKKYESIFNTVSDGHLLRIFAQYKDVWFKDMSKILTQNKLQFIIPIDYNSGLIQISYSDRYNADFWNAFKNEKDVKKYLTKILNEMFPEKNIKEPEWITMHFWKAGDHMWNVGVNTKKIQEKIDEIFIPKDIYILGETYSERQAWIEGAIETVHKKLNI